MTREFPDDEDPRLIKMRYAVVFKHQNPHFFTPIHQIYTIFVITYDKL